MKSSFRWVAFWFLYSARILRDASIPTVLVLGLITPLPAGLEGPDKEKTTTLPRGRILEESGCYIYDKQLPWMKLLSRQIFIHSHHAKCPLGAKFLESSITTIKLALTKKKQPLFPQDMSVRRVAVTFMPNNRLG